MSADQWHVVVPLAPTQEEWAEQFAASILDVDPTVDPDRAQAAMRWAFRVPRQRVSEEDAEADCWRCKGSREIPAAPGPLGQDMYDPCPICEDTE